RRKVAARKKLTSELTARFQSVERSRALAAKRCRLRMDTARRGRGEISRTCVAVSSREASGVYVARAQKVSRSSRKKPERSKRCKWEMHHRECLRFYVPCLTARACVLASSDTEQHGVRINPQSRNGPRMIPSHLKLRGGAALPQASIPLLPLRSGILLPGASRTFSVGRKKSVALVRSVHVNAIIAVVTQRQPSAREPKATDLYPMGTLARVTEVLRLDDGHYRVGLEGLDRYRIENIVETDPFL